MGGFDELRYTWAQGAKANEYLSVGLGQEADHSHRGMGAVCVVPDEAGRVAAVGGRVARQAERAQSAALQEGCRQGAEETDAGQCGAGEEAGGGVEKKGGRGGEGPGSRGEGPGGRGESAERGRGGGGEGGRGGGGRKEGGRGRG